MTNNNPLAMERLGKWKAPENWLRISTVDAHAGGEPLRVITNGFPQPEGRTMLERRRDAKQRLDHLRRALMHEPRGHADMYGALLTPPVSPDADFGVLFLHNEGYSTMCGHAIIALTKIAATTGMVDVSEPLTTLRIDTPAGLVTSYARLRGGQVESVYFHNVPAFVVELDARVEVPDLGSVRYDLAFGGAFYAFVEARDVGLRCLPECVGRLIEAGRAIKRAVANKCPIRHPFDEDLGFLYGVIFTGPPLDDEADSRNVCVFAEGEVDRSPTGTGVSARVAIEYARGRLALRKAMRVESIVGSCFTGRALQTVAFGPYEAVVPEVEGNAWITGAHEFLVDPDDPFRDGFLLR